MSEATKVAGHTRGPWAAKSFTSGIGSVVASMGRTTEDVHWAVVAVGRRVTNSELGANARRIVACVNACEGINPEAVPDLLEALSDLAHTVDPDGRGTVEEFFLPVLKRASDAIAKARGEES